MAASKITMKVTARTYGFTIANAVYAFFEALGFDHDDCRLAAMSCVFVRVRVGRHKSWVWGGAPHGN